MWPIRSNCPTIFSSLRRSTMPWFAPEIRPSTRLCCARTRSPRSWLSGVPKGRRLPDCGGGAVRPGDGDDQRGLGRRPGPGRRRRLPERPGLPEPVSAWPTAVAENPAANASSTWVSPHPRRRAASAPDSRAALTSRPERAGAPARGRAFRLDPARSGLRRPGLHHRRSDAGPTLAPGVQPPEDTSRR
jgi:hypothetical protein